MKRNVAIVFTLLVVFSISAPSYAQATGLTINVPLVGRVVGAGNTLFLTAVDISNNTSIPTQVDFFFDAAAPDGAPIMVRGSVTAQGLRPRGQGSMRARLNVHFDDFIDALVQAGMMSAAHRDAGVVGSLMLVFNGFTRAGEGSASARFHNAFGGGTVSVSLAGQVITTDEPQALVAVVRDTRGRSGPQLYTNMFLNNTGLNRFSRPAGHVEVEVSAFANSSGLAVGTPLRMMIASGQTITISQVLTALQVPSFEDTVLVYARVTAGDATIAGLTSTVDAVTRDGAVVLMSRAD